MFAALLLACSAPVDPSPWIGTWFGTVDWWSGDVDHWRTVFLDASATGDAKVPVHAVGSAWAAHDQATLACDGLVGWEPLHEGLVLVCELDATALPWLLP